MNFDEKIKTYFKPQLKNNNNNILSFRNKNILKDFIKFSKFPTLKINYEYQKIIYNYFNKINKKNNNNNFNNNKNNIRNKNLTPSPKNVILTLNYDKNKKIKNNNIFKNSQNKILTIKKNNNNIKKINIIDKKINFENIKKYGIKNWEFNIKRNKKIINEKLSKNYLSNFYTERKNNKYNLISKDLEIKFLSPSFNSQNIFKNKLIYNYSNHKIINFNNNKNYNSVNNSHPKRLNNDSKLNSIYYSTFMSKSNNENSDKDKKIFKNYTTINIKSLKKKILELNNNNTNINNFDNNININNNTNIYNFNINTNINNFDNNTNINNNNSNINNINNYTNINNNTNINNINNIENDDYSDDDYIIKGVYNKKNY